MTAMTARLATVAPDLVSRLDSLSDDQLGNVVAVAAREAVTRSGLDEATVSTALDLIGPGEPDTSARWAVEVIGTQLDERAWDIQELENDSQQYLDAFQRARAAWAVFFALDPDRRVAAVESIYEAQAALGSIDELRRLLAPLLPRA
jgi:hypothetical protein